MPNRDDTYYQTRIVIDFVHMLSELKENTLAMNGGKTLLNIKKMKTLELKSRKSEINNCTDLISEQR